MFTQARKISFKDFGNKISIQGAYTSYTQIPKCAHMTLCMVMRYLLLSKKNCLFKRVHLLF